MQPTACLRKTNTKYVDLQMTTFNREHGVHEFLVKCNGTGLARRPSASTVTHRSCVATCSTRRPMATIPGVPAATIARIPAATSATAPSTTAASAAG